MPGVVPFVRTRTSSSISEPLLLGNQYLVNSGDDSSLNEEDEESEGPSDVTHVYKRRWFILFVFCGIGFVNFLIWNTWDPIHSTAETVYGWNGGTIALLGNWGLIMMIPFSPIYAVILSKHGLRVALLITACFMLVGASIRLITYEPQLATWIINVGHILNGCAGIIPMAGAPLLSLNWFPQGERRQATALATGMQQMGMAFSFLIGPYMVREPGLIPQINTSDSTIDYFNNLLKVDEFSASTSFSPYSPTILPDPLDIHTLKKDIRNYLLLQLGLVVFFSILALFYFPAKPSLAPTLSATTHREKLLPSLKALSMNPKFWYVAMVYGLFNGQFNSYLVVIAIDLSHTNTVTFSQKDAGWLGFWTTLFGCFGGLVFAKLVDVLGHTKRILSAIIFCGMSFFLCFVLIGKGYIDFGESPNFYLINVTMVLSGMLSASTVPLIYELAPDILYPVSEEACSTMLVFVQNVIGVAVLLLLMIPHIGTAWLDWSVLSGIFLAFVLVQLLPNKNLREGGTVLKENVFSEGISS